VFRGAIIAGTILLFAALPLVVSANQMQVTLKITIEGNIVSMSGTVTDLATDAPIPKVKVSIEVRTPPGGTLHLGLLFTDSGGRFSDEFGLPPASPVGIYTIYLTASKSGYDDVTILQTFNVPEPVPQTSTSASPGPFPFLPVVVVIITGIGTTALVAVHLYARRRRVRERGPSREYLAATRALVKLEEMKAMAQVTDEEYRALKRQYQEKMRRSR